jgi:transposase-like protein
MTGRSQQYPPELRERAVRTVVEAGPNYDSQWAAINAVAQHLGVDTTCQPGRRFMRRSRRPPGFERESRRTAPHPRQETLTTSTSVSRQYS